MALSLSARLWGRKKERKKRESKGINEPKEERENKKERTKNKEYKVKGQKILKEKEKKTKKNLLKNDRVKTLLPNILLKKTDMGHLWFGVNGPRDKEGGKLFRAEEEGISNHHSGHEVRSMSKFVRGANISHRKDLLVGGLEVVVDFNSLSFVILYSSFFKIEPFNVRDFSGRAFWFTEGIL